MSKIKEAPSSAQMIPVLAVCAFILAFLFFPHTMAVVVGKILNVAMAAFASK